MHGEKRLVLSLRLKTNGFKGCVVREKGWIFQVVRIPKNVDIFLYEMMHRGMRHEEVQKLHADDLHIFRLMLQDIPLKERPRLYVDDLHVFRLTPQGTPLEEIPKRHADVPPVFDHLNSPVKRTCPASS